MPDEEGDDTAFQEMMEEKEAFEARFARTRASGPVWLVGTSAGTTGAANGAARLTGKVAGLVLTSSVTRQNSGGDTVFDTKLAAITVPVLIVANQHDSCTVTPPDDAAKISAAVTVNGGGKPGHMPAPEWADQRGVF